VLRELDRDAAGQGHVALAVEQPLAGEVDGDQRGRAGGAHADAGAAQVEQVGGAGGQEVLVVAQPHLQAPGQAGRLGVAEQAVEEPGALAGAGVDADGAGGAGRVAAGVLQGLPRAFEEDALMRIEDAGLARADIEEGGVEQIDVAQHAAPPHVVGQLAQLAGDALGLHLLVGDHAQAVHTAAQTLPEGRQVAGRGEAAGHADHRDVVETFLAHAFSSPRRGRRRNDSRRATARSRLCSRAGAGAAGWSDDPSGDPPRAAARDATVGCSNINVLGRSRPRTSRRRLITRMSSSEWPPRSKKLSSTPTRSTPSTSRQTRAIRSSRSVRGGTYDACGSPSTSAGAGRAFRSTLPLGLRGSAGSITKAAGTMYSGSRSRKPRRNASAAASPTT